MVTGTVTCIACGFLGAPAARYCASCGASLGSVQHAVGFRKIATALFCDVSDSTGLGQRLDAEAVRSIMETYFDAVSAVLHKHGGTVEKFVGDAVMAVFGVPAAHDDDAIRACRAATEILIAMAKIGRDVESTQGLRFEVRLGIETGEVVVAETARNSTFASGAAVNVAARLEQAAGPGECLIGPQCHRLVHDQVDVGEKPGLVLKGVDPNLRVHRLLGIRSEAARGRDTTLLATPMLGRSREFALLSEALERAVADRTCQLVTVLGAAGIGKSRLAAEFVGAVKPDVTVLRGRCASYGEGVTYWPLVEAVRQAVGLLGAEPEPVTRQQLAAVIGDVPDVAEIVGRIAPIAGLGGIPGPAEDTAWAVQRMLAALAANRPLLLVVDDLHWAEPGLVTLLEDVCASSRDAPILIIVLARPELLEAYPNWGSGRVNAVTASLKPLSDDDVGHLADGLLGGAPPAAAAEKIRSAAGGNPLFVQQLLAMIVDDGMLRRDGAQWLLAGDISSMPMPPSIAALLTARLDRLTSAERAVLGPAAVIGQVFYRAALTEMDAVPAEEVAASLPALAGKGLIRATASDLPGEEAFRFDHVLIRDAAYATLPKATRARLHEAFARWLEKHQDGQAFDDFIGGHLEAAFRNRAELGGLDNAARELGREAADRLATAGTHLLHADDGAAAALLERADALRADDGPDRWALQYELARATARRKAHRAVVVTMTERVLRAADSAGDRRWVAMARILLAEVRQETDPEGATEALRRKALDALELFTVTDDHYGLSMAYQALCDVTSMTAHWSERARYAALAASHADLAGRPRDAQRFRLAMLNPLLFGACPAREGLVQSRRQVELADHRAGRARAASYVAYFASLLDNRAEALDAWELADQLAADLRTPVNMVVTMVRSAASLATGAWPDAIAQLEQMCEHDRAIGDQSTLATDCATLAHALLHAGQVDRARRQVEVAMAASSADDVATQGLIQGAQSCLAAHAGDRAAAQRHATLATTSLPDDMLPDRALIEETCAQGATVLGDVASAEGHRQRALDLHQAKGNLAAVARLTGAQMDNPA